MKTRRAIALLTYLILLNTMNAKAALISATDLWDVSDSNNGTTVTNDSGMKWRNGTSSSLNMFGGTGGVESANAIFKDVLNEPLLPTVPEGFVHFVEWNTGSQIDLHRFNLVAKHDGTTTPPGRAFKHFTLYSGDGSGNWITIYDADTFALYGQAVNYVDSRFLELEVDLAAPIISRYFRAEFIQAAPKPANAHFAQGPRIFELDGYNTFADGTTFSAVPEPTTLALLGLGLAGVGFSRRKTT
jgi:hypothetical protein